MLPATKVILSGTVISSTTADGYGIFMNAASGGAITNGTIFNNMVNIGQNASTYAVNIENSDYIKMYHNTFNNNSAIGAAMRINTVDFIDFKNNIFTSASPASTDITALTNQTRDYNNFMPDDAGKNTNSINIAPVYLSASDVHTENIALQAGLSGLITLDIDGETRQNPPYMGADEFLGLVSWTGAVNTDWNNTGNWSSGQVPTLGTTVEIPVVVNFPETNTASNKLAEAKNLTIRTNAKMEISAGKYLTVYNNFTNEINGEFYNKIRCRRYRFIYSEKLIYQ